MQEYAVTPENDLRLVSDANTQPVQFETQRQVAVRFRHKGLGATRIRRELVRLFPNDFIPEHRAIHDWIKHIPNPNRKAKKKDKDSLDLPYDYQKSNQPDELKSYIHRLELVKQAVLTPDKANFTKRQAKHAKRVLHEFNDPHGLNVDLSAQYVVVHELSERELAGEPIDDIEDFFAYAPWLGDGNTNIYRMAQQTGRIGYVNFHLIALFVGSSDITLSRMLKPDCQGLIGVHAALGLPFFISWVGKSVGERSELHFLDRLSPELNERVESAKIEQWKKLANWRANLMEKWSGTPMYETPVSADKAVEENSND